MNGNLDCEETCLLHWFGARVRRKLGLKRDVYSNIIRGILDF
uniref:Uncharacterized protein n=1 Tax=Nelumbo nucifera TaxID=4432 RepID=A0A822Z8W7_NELNU|nr:TPA_asm: hypothetical protein HUJ06_008599 [Nelumbo nucifera]